jgi:hypothetical protein
LRFPSAVVNSRLNSVARSEASILIKFGNNWTDGDFVRGHLALQRITADAAGLGADAVVGIVTKVLPFKGVHEMMMMGTAAHHPALPAGQGMPSG